MLKEKSELFAHAYRLFDICLTVTAFIGAFFSKKYLVPETLRGLIDLNYYSILLMIVIIWYFTFSWFDVYISFRKNPLRIILFNTIKASFTALLILLLVLYFVKIVDVSRIMITIFFSLNISLLLLAKSLTYIIIARFRGKGYNSRNVLIIGSRERARDIIKAIQNDSGAGYKIIGCLDIKKKYIGKKVAPSIYVIGLIDHIEDILSNNVVDEMIIAMPLSLIQDAEKYIMVAEYMGVPVRIMPDWQLHRMMYRPGIADITIENFAGIPTLTLLTTPSRRGPLLGKIIFDYTIATFALITFLPILPVIILAIKLSSKGPVLFKQERLGLNGRHFTIYKFRTMIDGAEEMQAEILQKNEADGPAFKIKQDPRIIPVVGSLLRKTGFDELPQLINVFKGDMSIVGPRPPIPSEANEYEIWQRRRLSMKPGLTCIWQTSPNRNDVSFEEWMHMDLKYIDNWEFMLDCKILLQTAGVVLSGTGR